MNRKKLSNRKLRLNLYKKYDFIINRKNIFSKDINNYLFSFSNNIKRYIKCEFNLAVMLNIILYLFIYYYNIIRYNFFIDKKILNCYIQHIQHTLLGLVRAR